VTVTVAYLTSSGLGGMNLFLPSCLYRTGLRLTNVTQRAGIFKFAYTKHASSDRKVNTHSIQSKSSKKSKYLKLWAEIAASLKISVGLYKQEEMKCLEKHSVTIEVQAGMLNGLLA